MEWKKLNTILLVDDDPITNFINKRLLEKMNIATEVKVVKNGEEGVRCLMDHCFKTSNSPDLILLDINMPIMDGFEFLQEFNAMDFKNKEEVVIGILTTSSNSTDLEKIEKLGIRCFINKPLTEQKIKDFLTSCTHYSIARSS
jgi:CheY-like chemotaxis protein